MFAPVKDYPAILYSGDQRKTLIISDIHLGWEMNLARKGVHVPSQAPRMLHKLLKLIDKTKPSALTILGDVKHTIAKAEPGEWRDIPEFFESLLAEVDDVQIVRGNHDGNLEPLLPPPIQLHSSTGMTLNTIGLFHGHTWPAEKLLACDTLLMGHVHPVVAFEDTLGFRITAPVWIKAKCDVKKLAAIYVKRKRIKMQSSPRVAFKQHFGVSPKVKELLIMPCFNDFLGGPPVNRKRKSRRYIGPVLGSKAININSAEIYLLDGTFLGAIRQLATSR